MLANQKTTTLADSLQTMLSDGLFAGYTYSYPHKMSYRPFTEPKQLSNIWAQEKLDALFLYVHIPFCEMRCGFCNLFTVAKPKPNIRAPYPDVLRTQALAVKEELGDCGFSRLAIGGGTPTQLDAGSLAHVVETIVDVMGADLRSIPACCEMSPETVDAEKLDVLLHAGIDRASIGIQSFFEVETKSLRRPQTPEVARQALGLIRDRFQTLNIDLIYGIRGQTAKTWEASIRAALEFAPEELYLYPLYVRPLTGLGNSKREAWTDLRPELYLRGRALLLEAGYEQVSMRMFRLPVSDPQSAPEYRCTADGMVGLGVGARSYTRAVHYCTEYAVGRPSVLGILQDFVERDSSTFHAADFGFELDVAEQKRRFFILSVLSSEGFDPQSFVARFDEPANFDALQHELSSRGFGELCNGIFRLTADGMARSDVIGPWLYSQDVAEKIAEYELR